MVKDEHNQLKVTTAGEFSDLNSKYILLLYIHVIQGVSKIRQPLNCADKIRLQAFSNPKSQRSIVL